MAGDKLTSQDLYGDDSRLVLLNNQLKSINGELEKVAKNAAVMDSKLSKVGATPGNAGKLQSMAAETERLIQLESKLAFAKTETAKQEAVLRDQITKTNAENRAAAKQANAVKGYYEGLSASLSINKIKFKQLTEEEVKNKKVGGELANTIKKQSDELKRLDALMGSHVRNVGNYRSALGGLLGSIKGLFAAYLSLSGAQQLINNIFGQTKALDTLSKSFVQVLGSTEKAAEAQAFLSDVSERLGVDLLSTSKAYLKFAASAKSANIGVNQTNEIFESAVKSSAALGLSIDETEGVLKAFEQILSKGTVQAEELRGQLGDRLPGAFSIAAESMGVTTQELNKLLKEGKVVSTDFLPKFAKQLEVAFGVNNVNRIDTLAAAQGRFNREFTSIVQKLSAGDFFKGFFNSATNFISLFGRALDYFNNGAAKAKANAYDLTSATRIVSNNIQKETAEFNGLINVLNKLEPESDARSRLISEINTKYKEYLPNLLTEKSTLQEIAIAQDAVNAKLREKA